MGSKNPWYSFAMVPGMAALVGAGVGAGSALAWSERRVSGMDATVESLERRVSAVEAAHRTRPATQSGRPAA
jgi:hypothetical protein